MARSLPRGIIFAATFVPRTRMAQKSAHRNTANRAPDDGYLLRMAVRRSHWFQSLRPQALLIAAVERMPKEAEIVTEIGQKTS